MAQILANTTSPINSNSEVDWKLRVDWIYVLYSPTDSLTFRFGRQLFPSFLLSEYVDVAYVYPWREAPFVVYFVLPFKSFNGVSADYRLDINRDVNLTASIFGGNEKITKQFGNADASVEINDILGGSLTLNGDGWRVRSMVGRLNETAKADLGLVAVNGPTGIGTEQFANLNASGLVIFSAGGRYDKNNFVAYAEYAHISTSTSTQDTLTNSNTSFLQDMGGYYGMVGYRFGAFMPRYTYGFGDFTVGFLSANGRIYTQNLGLNYQLNSNVVFKIEYEQDKTSGSGVLLLNQDGTANTVSAGLDLIF
jgi:hypothetical protein